MRELELGIGIGLAFRALPGGEHAIPTGLQFDAAATSSEGSDVIDCTITIGTGPDTGLLLAQLVWSDPNAVGLAPDTVDFAGRAMTQVPGSLVSSGDVSMALYTLLAPPAGTGTCEAQMTGEGNFVLNLASYFGANLDTPVGAAVTAVSSSNNPHVNLAVTASNVALLAVAVDLVSGSVVDTPGGGLTRRGAGSSGTNPFATLGTLYDDFTDSGSPVALSVALNASKAWAVVAVELQRAS